MNEHLKTIVITTLISMMVVNTAVNAQQCGDYEITVISGPNCGADDLVSISPQAISESGDVVGYGTCPFGVNSAFYWTPATGLQFIPMPDGTAVSKALAISGTKVVGFHGIGGNEFGNIAFLYDYQTDEFTSLGTLPGGNWSEAHDINSSGQIAGYWGNNIIGPWKAFLWEDGKMIDIGPSVGGANSRALGINEAGAITGWWQEIENGERIAFLWEDGNAISLGPMPNGFSSTGFANNDIGRVTGDGKTFLDDNKTIVVQSFIWVNNQMTNLGTLPDTTFARARGINDQIRIVGYCHNSGLTDQAAFIWKEGEIADLNDLIPFAPNLNLERSVGINNAGQIAVAGRSDILDATVAFLLTPKLPSLPGDLNGDCQIGVPDLLLLFSSWGPCDTCAACPADLDKNCTIGTTDLLILLSNWG